MRLFQRVPPVSAGPIRLHVGSGSESIPGWINIDNKALPGVDRVLDIRRGFVQMAALLWKERMRVGGLPFDNVLSIYAEHFLEHLSFDEGLAFLVECRRVLSEQGVLRLSTPNLDWVYATHYHPGQWPAEADAMRDCMQLNRAFHGWGHQFLYNRQMLAAALRSAGFSDVVFCRYGESRVPELHGLERHETWQDSAELPHILIAEASGRAEPIPLPKSEVEEYRRDLSVR